MTGIYKITSPSEGVYIGQSRDINNRMRYYFTGNSCKRQTGLHRSIKKYGFENHKVDVVCELPHDCAQLDLDNAEMVYIGAYKDAGFKMLNMCGGGNSLGSHCEETKKKISQKLMGHPGHMLGKKMSEEARRKISESQKGKKISAEAIEKNRLAQIGRKHTPETMEKFRQRKPTEESRAKMREGHQRNNVWLGRKHRYESREKQSEAKKGHKLRNKLVLNVETGIFYDSLTDAGASIGVNMKAMCNRMRFGTKRFRNPFIYV